MRVHAIASLLLTLAASAPAHADDEFDRSPEARQLIQAARAGHPQPGTLVLRTPQGQVAFLLAAPCCDRFNPLFDSRGRRICAPTGGFAGHGDGRCPAWVAAAVAEAQRQAQRAAAPTPAASTIPP